MKRHILIFILNFSSFFYTAEQNSDNTSEKPQIIILYGCSSAGKTTLSQELKKTLLLEESKKTQSFQKKWIVRGIDDENFRAATPSAVNIRLWQQVNKDIQAGNNVIVDTVISTYYYDHSKANQFVVLTYCSPIALVQHVIKRNKSNIPHNKRKLKKVLTMFCRKFKATDKKQDRIATLKKADLQKAQQKKWSLNKFIKNYYFNDDSSQVYLASSKASYNFVIDTSFQEPSACAKKIKAAFLAH